MDCCLSSTKYSKLSFKANTGWFKSSSTEYTFSTEGGVKLKLNQIFGSSQDIVED